MLILGTAHWGAKTDAPTAHLLLSAFYEAGGREVDTATNYPINKIPADFRKAEKILKEWITAHGVSDLKITAKVGSIDNMRSPDHLLTQSFLLMCVDDYLRLFGANLDTFMIHWDNRDKITEIRESMQALAFAAEQGLRPGLSGIAHPWLYAKANEDFGLDFRIQLKYNVLESKYEHYMPFHGARRFIAYGVNAGGAKLGADERLDFLKPLIEKANQRKDRPPVEHFFQVGLLFAYLHPDFEGILIGPSSVPQLEGNLTFFRGLKDHDYTDFF
jgi:aryl-alcohol dehydrogenase-like predicted oxidoreductase